MRFVAALAGLILWGCTSVYVQTGNGKIDSTNDLGHTITGGTTTTEKPEEKPKENEKR